MTEPFDRDLPSPIAAVLELAAAARDAVVVYERSGQEQPLSTVQERMVVDTGVEDALIRELDREPATAVLLSGSAGGGKTLLLKQLKERYPDRFGTVVEDATHAETPDQTQTDALVGVFNTLRDGAAPDDSPPILVAMNTGMVIRFFDGLRRERGPDHGFTALEDELKRRLLLRPPSRPPAGPLPGRLLVVNLDGRRTAGGAGSLLYEMLGKLDPEDPGGIMAGAPRCATCRVRPYCFVRTNAEIFSADPARTVVARAGEQIALRRGRPLQPRAGWDLLYQITTAGERFANDDPCDRIAELAEAGDGWTVWQRLACNGPFAGGGTGAAAELPQMDPSFRPSEAVHEVLTGAGVDLDDDAARLERLLGAESGRQAVTTAAGALRATEATDAEDRGERGRALVRAGALAGHEDSFEIPGTASFRRALEDYRNPQDEAIGKDAAEELTDLVEDALVSAFGERVRAEPYFLIEAFSPRRNFDVLVRVDLRDRSIFTMVTPDPAIEANPESAQIVGYQPLAVLVRLRDVELRVDLPLYLLLEQIKNGAIASTADLEGFFHLRRAAEALGRLAADHNRPLLIRDRTGGSRYVLSQRTDRRGRERLGLEVIYS